MQNVLNEILNIPSSINTVDENFEKQIKERNWAFDYYLMPLLINYFKWLESSDEFSNFTYELKNIYHLSGWLSCVTGAHNDECMNVIQEIITDQWLIKYLMMVEHEYGTNQSAQQFSKSTSGLYGRRIGWYAVARILKPQLVIETGVDRGLGSTILCRALMRNAEEGFVGRYIGTDINPTAGYLLKNPLTQFGEIIYGDSITSICEVNDKVDLFINDSDHSAEYEEREYLAVKEKLSSRAIILGDNSHVTDKLYKFALNNKMKFLHYAEQPMGHWYPGAGIGAAF